MSDNKTNKILELATNTENPEKLKLALKVCLQANDRLEQEVKELKAQNKELQVGFDEMSELILDCFGKHPVPCDGMLYVPSHKYNNLARLLNQLNKESK